MKNNFRLLMTLFAFFCLLPAPFARADDGIFPPSAAAKLSIDFDGRGFLIHGRRTFLASGSLHYTRVPRALWRDRLLRMKRAGFNVVETYAFWNIHELSPGRFDFTGDKDLNAFLKLVHTLNMYAVVRVGPYVCAEWDSGGYPVWLRFQPGVRVREDEPQFEAAVDRWFDHVMPIVAANQIHRGGAVIMVQLENEYPGGWGREMPNPYFQRLRDKALALGLQVPYFFSGLHHGHDPAGRTPWDSAGRVNPWYTTELWPGWYNLYGPLSPADLRTYDRAVWKILAYGGGGFNLYMLHGGTDFGYTNSNEDASSYDYGAAIGQAGDLRPIYYKFKRAAWFARSFQDILENSENATDAYQNSGTNPAVRITARRSPAGTLLFLDNNTQDSITTQVKNTDGTVFPSTGALTIAPGRILPVAQNVPIAPGILLEQAAGVFGIAQHGKTTTVVLTGATGDPAEARFRLAGHVSLFIARFSPTAGGERSFSVNGRTLKILTVGSELADRTWFLDAPDGTRVVTGPDYIGAALAQKGQMHLSVERYSPTKQMTPPLLSSWTMRAGDAPAQTDLDTTRWKASPNPLPMGADGDSSAYAWYRAPLPVPQNGVYTLTFADAGDWLMAFIDGKPVGGTTIKRRFGRPEPRTLGVTLTSGPHTLAVLAAHYGRDKLFSYRGPIDQRDAKGLAGPVTLVSNGAEPNEQPIAVTNWKMHGGIEEGMTGPWKPTGPTNTPTPTFYRATFAAGPPESTGPHPILRISLRGMSRGFVWLNGHNLGRYPETVPVDGLYLPECWLQGGQNVLTVFDEEGRRPSAVRIVVERSASRTVTSLALQGM